MIRIRIQLPGRPRREEDEEEMLAAGCHRSDRVPPSTRERKYTGLIVPIVVSVSVPEVTRRGRLDGCGCDRYLAPVSGICPVFLFD